MKMKQTVRYCTPKLILSPTWPHPLPLLKMDLETKHKIELAVTQFLHSTPDIDSLTEQDVRSIVAGDLGIDLSELPHKILVRHLIESFLLSLPTTAGEDAGEETPTVAEEKDGSGGGGGGAVVGTAAKGPAEEEVEEMKPVVVVDAPVAKQSSDDSPCRVICKLSNKRDVAIGDSGQKTMVSIRELFWKDGKQIPSFKSISLSNEQWSIFRKSIPAIEEAITKVESRLRSEFERKQADDRHDRSKVEIEQNGGAQSRAEPIQKEGTRHKHGPMATGEGDEVASTVASTPRRLVPVEIIRFDGKNYLQWADRMESYLNHLQVAYVLSDPCPSAVGASHGELRQILSAVQKWTDDDHICRQNILNSLCDNLFDYYAKKTGSARDLWEEMKLIYLDREHGAKVSLVKKYIEFQMVEEKPVSEQVQEFHHIADSINASGMYVEEKFHVNVILSKLPPSWKPYSIQLMKEDYLPVWMLMNHLKAEEESRKKGNKGEALLPKPDKPVFHPIKKLGPQRIPMKKCGVPPVNHELDRDRKLRFCNICKKKGHLPEQCWFRKPGGKDSTNENDNVTSAKIVPGANTDKAPE